MIVSRDECRLSLKSSSSAQTAEIGAAIGKQVRPNDTILLFGDLGAGKTTFVRGMADALGAQEPVTSPTFTLTHEYHTDDLLVVHVDTYRLGGPDDVEAMGFLDYLGRGAVVIVEWAERLGDLAPPNALRVHIEDVGGENRTIRIEGETLRLESIADSLERLS